MADELRRISGGCSSQPSHCVNSRAGSRQYGVIVERAVGEACCLTSGRRREQQVSIAPARLDQHEDYDLYRFRVALPLGPWRLWLCSTSAPSPAPCLTRATSQVAEPTSRPSAWAPHSGADQARPRLPLASIVCPHRHSATSREWRPSGITSVSPRGKCFPPMVITHVRRSWGGWVCRCCTGKLAQSFTHAPPAIRPPRWAARRP